MLLANQKIQFGKNVKTRFSGTIEKSTNYLIEVKYHIIYKIVRKPKCQEAI